MVLAGLARSSTRTARRPGPLALLLLFAALAFAPGCRTVENLIFTQDPAPPWLQTVNQKAYVLEVGDIVDVSLFNHPELSADKVQIQQDGKISLHMIGFLKAGGLTPEELQKALTQAFLSEGLREPDVLVRVRESAGLRVFVGGEVGKPGMVEHDGSLNLMGAILKAGGLAYSAEIEEVVVIRDPGNGGAPLMGKINLKRYLDGEISAPPLQAYDVIFVPKTTIAKLNMFVEQYVVRLIPVTYNVGFSYTKGRVRGL